MYQFDRFSLFLKCPFFLDHSLCHFELEEFLKLLFVVMAFFHILVVKEHCRKQNKSVLESMMVVLLPIYSPEKNRLNETESVVFTFFRFS